jgi:hypothetical protein
MTINTLKDFFWVLPNEEENWFQLRTCDELICLATASTSGGILKKIYDMTLRYGSLRKLQIAISQMSEGSELTEKQYTDLFPSFIEYEDYMRKDIDYIIDKAMEKVNSENKNKRSGIKLKTKKVTTTPEKDHEVVSPSKEEKTSPVVSRPKVIKRRSSC